MSAPTDEPSNEAAQSSTETGPPVLGSDQLSQFTPPLGAPPPSAQPTAAPTQAAVPAYAPPQYSAPPQYAQPQYGNPATPQYAQYQQYPPSAGSPQNVLSIIAFIASLVGFVLTIIGSIAAIICGHIALSQIKRSGERGRGFAIAALIIGYVQTAFWLLLFLFFAVWMTALGAAVGASSTFDDPYESYGYESVSEYGPVGMESGGAVFDDYLEVLWTDPLESGDERVAADVDRDDLPLDVTLYVDYACAHCQNFEKEYGEAIEDELLDANITFQVYPVSILDSTSNENFSTRAANVFACTVDLDSYYAYDVHRALLDIDAPLDSGDSWPSDDDLIDLVEREAYYVTDEFESCVRDQHFAPFVEDNTEFAVNDGLLGLEESEQNTKLSGTPTVVVGGERWDAEQYPDFETFLLDRIAELEKASA